MKSFLVLFLFWYFFFGFTIKQKTKLNESEGKNIKTHIYSTIAVWKLYRVMCVWCSECGRESEHGGGDGGVFYFDFGCDNTYTDYLC